MAGQGELCRGCAVADVLRDRIRSLEHDMRQIASVKAAVEIMDDAEEAAGEFSRALNAARDIARRALPLIDAHKLND